MKREKLTPEQSRKLRSITSQRRTQGVHVQIPAESERTLTDLANELRPRHDIRRRPGSIFNR